ncbi:ribonucleotide-diphosphate reductase subunit beta, partial [Staphylococcus aureus]
MLQKQTNSFEEYFGKTYQDYQIQDFVALFWRQNISQMWVETEFKVSKDIASWKTLSEAEQDTFKKALAGLT